MYKRQAVLIPALIVTLAWGLGLAAHAMDYLSKRDGPAFELSLIHISEPTRPY